MRKGIIVLAVSLVALLTCWTAGAQNVAPQFCDGMVLAKGQPVYVFGEGDASGIVVSLAGKTAKAKQDGIRWIAKLPAMKAGGPYVMEVRSGSSAKTFSDVYVGTVIMASGQSNMQFKLHETNTPAEAYVDDPLLRSFSLPRLEEGDPYSPADGWVRCTAENAGKWSAIGYLVGREVRERTGEAVGIVNCYQGASIIQTWIPEELATKPQYILPAEDLHFDHSYPYYLTWNRPGVLFNHDVAPFAPYGVSLVMWYQGESNTGKGEAKVYAALAAEMVGAWRKAFRNGKLPFVMVQIADYKRRNDEAWKAVQQAQMEIPSLVKGVKVVKSSDVCEDNNIHPKSKAALSHRIVEAAGL